MQVAIDWCRQDGYLPAGRNFDRHIVNLLGKILVVDGVGPIRVFEDVSFRPSKKANGNYQAASSHARPPLYFDIEGGGQRNFRVAPVRLLRQIDFSSDGNVALYLVLEIFLAGGLVLVPLLDSPSQGFQPSKGDIDLSLEGAVFGEVQIRFAFDA